MYVQASVTGRPGAVYVDVPSDVLFAPATAEQVPKLPEIRPARHDQPSQYLHRPLAARDKVQQAISLLQSAQR